MTLLTATPAISPQKQICGEASSSLPPASLQTDQGWISHIEKYPAGTASRHFNRLPKDTTAIDPTADALFLRQAISLLVTGIYLFHVKQVNSKYYS
jgi:hypothetical protein